MLKFLSIVLLLAVSASAANSDWNKSTKWGYIPVDPKENTQLFYWVVESEGNVTSDPVVLWMSGGPGCSGELAMFLENGPWTVDAQGNLHDNPYSWSKAATIIYIDQPPGTGFSYANSNYVHDSFTAADLMITFFRGFFKKYPMYARQDFYIFGESYAGHYVPALALAIAQAKKADKTFPVNLKGIAIGNGLVDPITQYPSMPQYAYSNKLIDHATYLNIAAMAAGCPNAIKNKDWDQGMDSCNAIMRAILKAAGDVNPMKIDERCKIQHCFNYSNITKYLNTPSVKKTLGIPDRITWQSCNSYNTDFYFTNEDQLTSFSPILTNFMHAMPKARVLIYYGDLDLVCPWTGGITWTDRMDWPGQEGFGHELFYEWQINGESAGAVKAYETLTFLRVYKAGHMVPTDAPGASLDMLSRFINNVPFTTSPKSKIN